MIDEKKLIEAIVNTPTEESGYNPVYLNGCATRQLEILDIIDKQPKVGEWIPCSEKLPNCNGCYLVWRPHFWGGEIGMPAICYFDGQNTWHDSYGVDFTRILNEKDVIAWQPLPQPYKGE